MGSDTVAWTKVGGQSVTFRCSSDIPLEPGQKVTHRLRSGARFACSTRRAASGSESISAAGPAGGRSAASPSSILRRPAPGTEPRRAQYPTKEAIMDFSYQLYSARNEASLDDTLEDPASSSAMRRSKAGAASSPIRPRWPRASRPPASTMPTAHMGFAQLEDTDAALKIAETVGIKTVYCPAPPTADYREGTGDWQELADRPRQDRARPSRRPARALATTTTIGNSPSGAERQDADRTHARLRPTCSGKWTSPGW